VKNMGMDPLSLGKAAPRLSRGADSGDLTRGTFVRELGATADIAIRRTAEV
jgi:hypothetical protein